jgi:hypothetical protein
VLYIDASNPNLCLPIVVRNCLNLLGEQMTPVINLSLRYSEKTLMKMFLILTLITILTSCSQVRFQNRGPAAFVPSTDGDCSDAFLMAIKYKADPEDIAGDLRRFREGNELPVILDIGGEGRYVGAINLNPQPITSTTGEAGHIIPNWVPGRGDKIPFPQYSVDMIHLENAPINPATMEEMLRVMRPRGKIHLSHPHDYTDSYIEILKNYFPQEYIQRIDNGIISEVYILVP